MSLFLLGGYWEAGSRFAGYCGHKHKTEESAAACLEAMIEKFKSKRWPKKVA